MCKRFLFCLFVLCDLQPGSETQIVSNSFFRALWPIWSRVKPKRLPPLSLYFSALQEGPMGRDLGLFMDLAHAWITPHWSKRSFPEQWGIANRDSPCSWDPKAGCHFSVLPSEQEEAENDRKAWWWRDDECCTAWGWSSASLTAATQRKLMTPCCWHALPYDSLHSPPTRPKRLADAWQMHSD